MAILKSLKPCERGEHSKGPVNQYSEQDSIRYARSLNAPYPLIVMWNGLRYQIKHGATETILRQEGWAIVARIPAAR